MRPLPAPADGSAATALQSRSSNNSSRAQPRQSWKSQKDQQQQLEQQRQPRALAAAPLVSSLTQLGVRLNEPPSKPPQQEERDKEFFANVGDAIRSLREDYPLLFVKDLNYSIYRPDLEFKDPNLSFSGLKSYKVIFWSLRFHGRLLLKATHVQVLRIWQPEDAVIKLRWQINATPRLGSPGTFDGISVYRLDRHGKVYQHEVTDVQMRDPPITNPLLYALNYVLSPRPQTQQVPCPGGYFVDPEEDTLPEVLAAAPLLLDYSTLACSSGPRD